MFIERMTSLNFKRMLITMACSWSLAGSAFATSFDEELDVGVIAGVSRSATPAVVTATKTPKKSVQVPLQPTPLVVKTQGDSLVAPSVEVPLVTPAARDRHAAKAQAEGTMHIRWENGALIAEPARLSLEKPVNVQTDEAIRRAVTIFSRDDGVISWDKKSGALIPRGNGRTEVFVVYQDKMVIVPVVVTDPDPNHLTMPDAFAAVGDSIYQADLDQSFATMGDNQAREEVVSDDVAGSGVLDEVVPQSVQGGEEEAQQTAAAEQQQRSRYQWKKRDAVQKTITVQVMDERSQAEAGVVYPVEGLNVQIVGTKVKATTSAVGTVRFADVPAGARVLVAVWSDQGAIAPTYAEVKLKDTPAEELVRVRVAQRQSFEVYLRLYQAAQQDSMASVCLRMMDQKQPQSRIKLGIGSEAIGPLYFGDYGPEPLANMTGGNGRACYFNVKPGLTEIAAYDDQNQLLAATTIPLFAGAHTEDDWDVMNSKSLRSRLAVMSSAQEQVFQGERANAFMGVHSADMKLVGRNIDFDQFGWGELGIDDEASFFKKRVYALNQGAEYETVLYAIDSNHANDNVLPLMPRGFVEDTFNQLYLSDSSSSVAYDPSLGALIVQYGLQKGEKFDDLNLRVVDQAGREVDTGWYFGSQNEQVVKAIFFNVPAGVYSVIAETRDHFWLDATTMAVDFWTTSVVQLGSPLTYQP